ncbi:L-lactate permease [Bacillus sporothermodurans]|uniref:L-lactate permease n=1 Tax=Heyndrickxia sporothermodurans TaxID=46224 RepID=UPI00192CA96A|nr:L-lactate permease [Heyndrickxia sporothermodurans]MBL5768754.1 L-lactate permease [Heyndrickxia sporothermodurans]MBL5772480.1 L-lactate permease [Heyndrickxia sporothermodurans]MBL5776007.1 L-lactate permease [Heyndrickxia sporothermodurans]MBL5779517.1 L-lactate permease [Heyndrickxia sporothermodurans]MBL5786637.1 L-lactate permease [Heyndrickxia sporothermodurans]
MTFFIALLPILGIFFFLFFFKLTSLRAGIIAYIMTIIITIFYSGYHLSPENIIHSSVHGILISFIAAYVLFFGIFLFHLIDSVGGVNVNPKVDHVAHVKVDHPFVTSNMFL